MTHHSLKTLRQAHEIIRMKKRAADIASTPLHTDDMQALERACNRLGIPWIPGSGVVVSPPPGVLMRLIAAFVEELGCE